MGRAPALTPSRATEPGDVWPARVTEHQTVCARVERAQRHARNSGCGCRLNGTRAISFMQPSFGFYALYIEMQGN